jgi:hypothetical protein
MPIQRRGRVRITRAGCWRCYQGEQLYSAPIGALLPKLDVGVLELAGLVETEKVGRARECWLGPAATLGEAAEWIEAHRRAWEDRLDRFVERVG